MDKIVIAQESLGRFINNAVRGAYASMTKVDFLALDRLMVKPVGVYGSKKEIVKLLQEKGVVNEEL